MSLNRESTVSIYGDYTDLAGNGRRFVTSFTEIYGTRECSSTLNIIDGKEKKYKKLLHTHS